MRSYQDAVNKLNGRTRRKLENNTYLEVRDANTIAVKLHATDVVTYRSDGSVTLNSGGWRTVTTKDRLNKYSPVRIWTERGVWYVSAHGGWDKLQTYQDGMSYREKEGTLSGTGKTPLNLNKEKKRISAYAKRYVEALAQGRVPAPSGGDCWHCCMKDEQGRTWGESSQDKTHIEQHIAENYFVPSLAYQALETFGGSMAAKQTLYELTHGKRLAKIDEDWLAGVGIKQIQKAIQRYVARQLGYQA
jgi:hypothetical protein